MAYYNDNDLAVCAWLRELAAQGCIAEGAVDGRPIEQVRAVDLVGHARCHFFAGIGGWDYALRLAGWPEDRPVWTGSCPCQPFSCAGRRLGTDDPRHLWPRWRELIEIRRPPTIFGEQVASAAGREWLAGVRADLEALGYAVGCADLCAASIAAPHIRQRLYWVADYPQGRGLREPGGTGDGAERLGDSELLGRPGQSRRGAGSEPSHANPWSDFDVIPCRDGAARRVEPGVRPLAHGVPARVVRLRGYGNAIVPQTAAEFVRAFLEAEGC